MNKNEPSDPRAIVYNSWLLDLQDLVPDETEQNAVMCSALKYQLSLFGAEGHEIREPQTEIGKAALKVLQRKADAQYQRAQEIRERDLENLRRANAAKAAKREQPSAGAYTYTEKECPRNAPAMPITNTNTGTITKIDIIGLLGEKKSLFEISLDLLEKGHKIKADTIRTAAAKCERGEIRKKIGAYLAGCFRDKFDLPDTGHKVAGMLRAVGFQNLECLECYGISVQNSRLLIECTLLARNAIETELADPEKADKMRQYMQGVGAATIEYKITKYGND